MPLNKQEVHALLRELDRIEAANEGPASFRETMQAFERVRGMLREVALLQEWVEDLQRETQLPLSEIFEAVERVVPLVSAQAQHAAEVREQLLDTLMVDPDVVDPVPRASVAQARRVAETRNRLLAAGAWTVAAVAEVRGVAKSTARSWIARQRRANRLVSVTVRGETYVPALLLDEAAEPYAGTEAVLGPLRQAGMDAWAVWVWLDAPSSWLDGHRPADLLARSATDRAAEAARCQAANATSTAVAPDVA